MSIYLPVYKLVWHSASDATLKDLIAMETHMLL